MEKALLLAANPDSTDIHGNILAHATHLARYGGVIWGTGYGGKNISDSFKHKDVKVGYFYNTTSKKVDHWFAIVFIQTHEEIENKEIFELFVPSWRKKDYQKGYEGYWILIKKIYPLKKQYDLSDFIKISDGKPVEFLRTYSIVYDNTKYERNEFEY